MRYDINYIEIELINGKRVLFEPKWNKVYDLHEDVHTFFHWSKSFPFIKLEKKRCVSFRFISEYETIRSSDDPKFAANCTLVQLATLFGVKVKPFELSMVENELGA